MLCWRIVKRAGVLLEPKEFPCDFFLWRYLVYSIGIDTIEVLRERVENSATTIRNNRGMLERLEESFVGSFIIVSTTTPVTFNSFNRSCND
jgi:hypothetical protein